MSRNAGQNYVPDGVLEAVRAEVEKARSQGFESEEEGAIAALVDVARWRSIQVARLGRKLDRAQAKLEQIDAEGSRPGPPFGDGRHSKGGLYGDANDYFGEDREELER